MQKVSDEESIRLLNKDRTQQDMYEVEAMEATLYKWRIRSYFFLTFWPCHEACGIPVLLPWMESVSLSSESTIFTRTTREVPSLFLLHLVYLLCVEPDTPAVKARPPRKSLYPTLLI